MLIIIYRHHRDDGASAQFDPDFRVAAAGGSLCFIAMKIFGVDANIVALSGIAIAIGTIVDMGIIITENIFGIWNCGVTRRRSPGNRSAGISGGGRRRLDGGIHHHRQLSAGLYHGGGGR